MKAGAKSENEDSRDRPRACRARCPAWKRALDVILVVLTAPVSLLLGAAIGLVIKLGSRGPVFFRQERVGHQGRSFYMVKFRTMKAGADTSTHRQHLQELIGSEAPMTKLDAKGDKRVVPFGAILRATGLDELPQLINILSGEMSLVGPRPCMHYEYERYSASQRRRFEAFPGLTGLWQVSGKNHTTFSEMIRLDIWYAEHQSVWLDLKIIALTAPALTSQVMETRLARRGRGTVSPSTGEGNLRKSGEIL